VIHNLDSSSGGVYLECNLIEARAAAILTPHLMRHAPAVFLGAFSAPSVVIKAGENDWVMDKLLEQVFSFFCRDAAGCVSVTDQIFLSTSEISGWEGLRDRSV